MSKKFEFFDKIKSVWYGIEKMHSCNSETELNEFFDIVKTMRFIEDVKSYSDCVTFYVRRIGDSEWVGIKWFPPEEDAGGKWILSYTQLDEKEVVLATDEIMLANAPDFYEKQWIQNLLEKIIVRGEKYEHYYPNF